MAPHSTHSHYVLQSARCGVAGFADDFGPCCCRCCWDGRVKALRWLPLTNRFSFNCFQAPTIDADGTVFVGHEAPKFALGTCSLVEGFVEPRPTSGNSRVSAAAFCSQNGGKIGEGQCSLQAAHAPGWAVLCFSRRERRWCDLRR